jgi:hypothetical protein
MEIDDDWNEQDDSPQDTAMEISDMNPNATKRPLLMTFCPHDSSMLYPKVCLPNNGMYYNT